MEVIASYCTDVGNRKKVNQDSLCLESWEQDGHTMLMAVVCDGMGGLQQGEIASSSLVHSFVTWFEEDLPRLLMREVSFGILRNSLEQLVYQMNQKLALYGEEQGVQLGTTVTAVLLFDDQGMLVVHVGDCRLYELTDHVIQLTEDQTYVELQVKKGLLTREQAKTDSRQNIILQCVGDTKEVMPDIRLMPVRKEASYIICSDGFRHKITEEEMLSHLSPNVLNSQEIIDSNTKSLVELCKDRGEMDNISVVVLRTF